MIKRIEALENKINHINGINDTNHTNNSQTRPGMATEGQLNFIKGLKGKPWPEMTKQEASDYINKLKAIKDTQQERPKSASTSQTEGAETAENLYNEEDMYL